MLVLFRRSPEYFGTQLVLSSTNITDLNGLCLPDTLTYIWRQCKFNHEVPPNLVLQKISIQMILYPLVLLNYYHYMQIKTRIMYTIILSPFPSSVDRNEDRHRFNMAHFAINTAENKKKNRIMS